jgi:large subunit ribosomal protein L13
MKQTYMAKSVDIDPQWFVVDAEGRILGRLATKIATVLMGKHKPAYTPHVDTGDFVVVINAEKIAVTGRKMTDKIYDYNTGYPGGRVEVPLKDMLAKKPTEVLGLAVKRMLPKTKLGRQMFTKLKVYAGPDHPHEAQGPEPLALLM